MIGLLIITHETIGQAYQTLANHFFETTPAYLRILGVKPKTSLEEIVQAANILIQEVRQKDGVLILNDIFGATPCNIAQQLIQSNQQKVTMLTGLNAPMMIKALQYAKERENLDTFTDEVLQAAIKGIMRIECQHQ